MTDSGIPPLAQMAIDEKNNVSRVLIEKYYGGAAKDFLENVDFLKSAYEICDEISFFEDLSLGMIDTLDLVLKSTTNAYEAIESLSMFISIYHK